MAKSCHFALKAKAIKMWPRGQGLASRTTSLVELVVQAELCSRAEEATCLRAMVSQLREQLDTERRLNAAIKDKKVALVSSDNLLTFIFY